MGAVSIHRRRLRVMLQQPVEAADEIGGTVRSFADVTALWAALEPVRGLERAEADRAEGAVTHRLTIRWRAGITTATRFLTPLAVFHVRAVYDPTGRRRDLVCLVEEVQV